MNEGFVLPTKVDPCFKLFAKKLGLETKVDHRDYDTNTLRFLIKNVFFSFKESKITNAHIILGVG